MCETCKYHNQYRRGCSVIPGGVYPADAKCQPEDRYAQWIWADDVIFGAYQQRYRGEPTRPAREVNQCVSE